MALEFSLTSLTFSDGTSVALGESSVVVVVGPNNGGKSQALRDINARLCAQPHAPPVTLVVNGLTIHAAGSDEDLIEWLDEHAHVHPVAGLERQYSIPTGNTIGANALRSDWHNRPQLGNLARMFVALANGEQRLQLAASVGVHDLTNQPPSNPLQVLFADETRERTLADATRDAFGTGVIVNRVAGQNVHLHVGEIPADFGPPVVTNARYREALNTLPHVHQQGDGFKSYVGLILLLTSAEFPLVLVDEPEAFLHPPQARALGRRLAQLSAASGSQLIIATHSLDVLRGVLAASDSDITVVRLERDGDINRAAVLEPERVRELWSDPIIRFSNALDGIFHQGVVVCEGDADARFYDATLHAYRQRNGAGDHGILFTHCGGKERVPVVVNAVRGLDVPVSVICDIDVLRLEQPLRRIVEGLGMSWDQIQQDWNIVRTAIDNSQGTQPLLTDVRTQIDGLLKEATETRLSPQLQQQVRGIAKAQDPWQIVKRAGVAGIPAGDAAQAWRRLDGRLRAGGLFVVPVGELERWDTTLGGHGPKWVVPALQGGLHEADGPHSAFIADVAESLT